MDEYPDFQRMPIGFPTNNRELFIVHPDGTDVPRGIPGELCIAGAGLAQGYYQRAELTDEKFPDALGALGKRVYRTGDRVVLDDEYRVVYLDRVDRQVKHAGYRIELSEPSSPPTTLVAGEPGGWRRPPRPWCARLPSPGPGRSWP